MAEFMRHRALDIVLALLRRPCAPVHVIVEYCIDSENIPRIRLIPKPYLGYFQRIKWPFLKPTDLVLAVISDSVKDLGIARKHCWDLKARNIVPCHRCSVYRAQLSGAIKGVLKPENDLARNGILLVSPIVITKIMINGFGGEGQYGENNQNDPEAELGF